jgi:hypothetical protein
MVLVIQTEEENEAFLAAIEAVMSKGEESNTVNELNFLGYVVPIVESWEQMNYGISRICTKCAERNRRDGEDKTKVTLDAVTTGRIQTENVNG